MNAISEGFERRTEADFAHFLDVARGSAGEVHSMLYLVEDRRFVVPDITARLRTDFVVLSKGVAQLAKYLRA
jgi:four helix bundle protein